MRVSTAATAPPVAGRLTSAVAALRRRHPVVDHAITAAVHYARARGDGLAGAVTYFSFLSLFPLIAIAYAVLGQLAQNDPELRRRFTEQLETALPGLTGEGGLDIESIASAGSATLTSGVVGALGLIYAGLGCLEALRNAMRQMWALGPTGGSLLRRKLDDLVLLVLLGATVLLATAASSLTTAFTEQLLSLVGLTASTTAVVTTQVVVAFLAIAVDTGVLLVVLTRVAHHRLPRRNVVTGALLGAVGIEVLKQLATRLLGSFQTNAVYGTFAVTVSLLVYTNLLARVVMYAAAWAATGPEPTVEAELASRGEQLGPELESAVEAARQRGAKSGTATLALEHLTTAGTVAVAAGGLVGTGTVAGGREVGAGAESSDGAERHDDLSPVSRYP